MSSKVEFWERMTCKYEQRNAALEKRERELNYKLKAMKTLMGEDPDGPCNPCPSMPQRPPEGDKDSVKDAGHCNFFSGLFNSIIPSKKSPQEIPTKDGGRCGPPPQEQDDCICPPEEQNAMENRKLSIKSPIRYQGPQEGPEEETCVCAGERPNLNQPPPIQPQYQKNDLCQCEPCQLDELLMAAEGDSICKCADNSNGSASLHGSIEGGSSMLSLKSQDLYYMQQIHDMVTNQRNMMKQIANMEQQEAAYQQVLKEFRNVDSPQDQCLCNQQETRSISAEKNLSELKLENILLKNELKDMRTEVRQTLEKLEGPMLFKIESEHYKCLKLEEQLEQAAKEAAECQAIFQKEINTLKMELCHANSTCFSLTAANEALTQRCKECEEKCAQLQDELIRQKLSEAETIKRLKQALDDCQNAMNVQKNDSCNLIQIARELSKTMKECEPCKECKNYPSDVTTTAKYLKEMADMFGDKMPKTSRDPAPPPAQLYQNQDDTIIETGKEIGKDSSENFGLVMDQAISVEIIPKDKSQEKFKLDSHLGVRAGPTKAVESSTKVEDPRLSLTPRGDTTEGRIGSICASKLDQVEPALPPPIIEDIPKSSSLSSQICTCAKRKSVVTLPPPPPPPPSIADVPSGGRQYCKCKRKPSVIIEPPLPEPEEELDRIWPTDSERLKVTHQVVASTSKDLLKSATSVKCLKVKENFPFDVDTQVDIIDRPPDGVHVTTTITKSGMLEVVTEGPEGVIETTLVYTESGNVEVVTEILEYSTDIGPVNLGTVKALPPCGKGSSTNKLGGMGGKDPDKCKEAAMRAKMNKANTPSQTVTGKSPSGILGKKSCTCAECPPKVGDKSSMTSKDQGSGTTDVENKAVPLDEVALKTVRSKKSVNSSNKGSGTGPGSGTGSGVGPGSGTDSGGGPGTKTSQNEVAVKATGSKKSTNTGSGTGVVEKSISTEIHVEEGIENVELDVKTTMSTENTASGSK